VIEESNGKVWASGNIRLGDIILLVDSDTRVPMDCLLDAASEMEASPEIAILQYSSGVMKVTNTFFEVRVFISSNIPLCPFMLPSFYSLNTVLR
jgi:cellulose synthase/poly-beta-1,6-N-acetylglucosamine synthase-like glycosyltransferase